MIALLIGIIVFAVAVFILCHARTCEDYTDQLLVSDTGLGLAGFSIFLVIFLLVIGYSEPKHEFTKEEVVQTLRDSPNPLTIKLAREWNEEEHMYNNYFYRFTLRDEDPIDIDQILLEYTLPEDK